MTMSRDLLLLLAILLIMLGVSNNLHWGGNNSQYTLDADAKGYYGWLPATLVYGDLNYGFFEEMEEKKYFIESQFYDYKVNIDGKTKNKYFFGTALLIAPFYLVAHIYALIAGEPDGYSQPYVV